tara:strand:- start:14215 stop:15276 length:1062 start_codon:yes stop_codon:yes gene_type:complete
MASSYSDRLKLELMETGANANTWGQNTNTNLQTIDAFNAGYLSKSVAGDSDVTLTTNNADPNAESSNKVIEFTGTLTGNIKVFIPAVESNYIFFNNTSGSFTLTVAPTGHAANGVAIAQGAHTIQYCVGNKVIDLFAGSLGTVRAIDRINIGDNIAFHSNGVVAATTLKGDGAGLTGVQEFPAGTKALFVQSAAPTGFTIDTTSALNNSTLKVVTGTGGGTGGSDNFTDVFTTKNATGTLTVDMSGLSAVPVSGTSGDTTISTPTLVSHNHPRQAPGGQTSGRGRPGSIPGNRQHAYNMGNNGTSTGSTGGGGAHSHPLSGNVSFSGTVPISASLSVPAMTLKSVDTIIATKD